MSTDPSPSVFEAFEDLSVDTDQEKRWYAALVLRDRNLRFADFSESSLYGADLIDADLRKAKIENARLQGADLTRAKLQGANLERAELQGAKLEDSHVQSANLRTAQLQGANLVGAKLQEADLKFAELQGANLLGASLGGADLSSAGLQGANLSAAFLLDANLLIARLQGANLRGARLNGTNLTGAQLHGANLWDTKLQGADLEDAQLHTTYVRNTITRAVIGKIDSCTKTVVIPPREYRLYTSDEVIDIILDEIPGNNAEDEVIQTVKLGLKGRNDLESPVTCREEGMTLSEIALPKTEEYAVSLRELACADMHVARGIVKIQVSRTRTLSLPFARGSRVGADSVLEAMYTRAALTRLMDPAGDDCPGLVGVPEEQWKEAEEALAEYKANVP